jgi:hypothetical protein
MRTAGSHGPFDLIAVRDYPHNVVFVQCKRVKTLADYERLRTKFKANPPFKPSKKFHQFLEVWVGAGRDYWRVVV